MKSAWVLVVAIVCGLVMTVPAAAADQAPGQTSVLFPKGSHPYGASLPTWADRIGQWIYGEPFDQNPAFDQTGQFCAVDQHGPVWFIPPIFALPGTPRPVIQDASRTCLIPQHKALLLDIGAIVDDYPCPDPNFHPAPGQSLYDFLINDAKPVMDSVNELDLTLDGQPVHDVLGYRFHSAHLFSLTGDPSLSAVLDPCITGTPQPAIIDGFFLLFKPLSPGAHTIVVHGTNTFGDNRRFTYYLAVD
jgi:hypothetical protein